MLHFAYGSNMHRAVMRKHAPCAAPIGVARLENYRFTVTADGYASVEPRGGHVVHGVMWRLTPRDRVTLDAWENIAGGLYRAEILPVRQGSRRRPALVYIARQGPRGPPKPGYMEIVVRAAREWKMPQDYIACLTDWLPTRPSGAGYRKLGDFV